MTNSQPLSVRIKWKMVTVPKIYAIKKSDIFKKNKKYIE